jgi:uncharacterized protein (TIGR02996 family)
MSDATGTGLLHDIIEHPDDDTPRLIYADWLEEHDQPERAAFIRLQLERARLPAGDARAARLLRREKAVLKQHGKAWGETNLGLLGELRRGFIEHVTCAPDQVLMSGAELTERFPVRSLCLRAGGDEVSEIRRLAQQPWLARIAALRIVLPRTEGGCLGSAGLEALLESPYLAGLRVLELPYARIQATGARALAQARHLTALRELDLTWCLIGPEGMAALARAAHLAGLNRLVLEATQLGPDGAAALAESPHLRQLRDLDLARSRIQVSGVRELTASPVLATVERLRLGRLRLAVLAAKALGRCRHLGNLRELDLNSNRMADDGAAALAEGKAFAGLRRLLLRRNRITRAGVKALAAATHWTELEHLELSANELTARERQQAREWFRKGLGVRL